MGNKIKEVIYEYHAEFGLKQGGIMIGIYGIRNTINHKIYIGQSIDVNIRFTRHKYQLKKNIHNNQHLQNAWNKYGSDSFEFIVLVECDKDDLNVREEIEVGKFEKCMVYNISEDFTSRTGKLNPFFGRSHSSESKEKMSKWKKTHYVGKGNPNFGGKNSCVLQELMRGSNNCNAKLSEDDVRKIKMRLTNKEKHQQIADDFNVSRSVITRINNGTRWGHINKGE